MKTKIVTFALFAFVLSAPIFAQDRTTVTATGSDISDNLDLKAVASIFGDSQNLEDFEQRLNDPNLQISNLDLNNDNEVDYLRVIESVESNTHLIIIQAVLDKDVYQDVATIEVEKGSNNQVQVQVVGNTFMYGQNYIYEPVYVNTPVIYNHFWVTNYRPYVSSWYWNYYPGYYHMWNPYPIYRYRRNVHVHINIHNHYNYVTTRRSQTAAVLYNGRRANGYERQYPDRAFDRRNANVTNRYELDKTRTESIKRQGYNGQTRTGTTRNTSVTNGTTRTANVKAQNYNTTRVRTNDVKAVPPNTARTRNEATQIQRTPTNAGIRTQNPIKVQNQSNQVRNNSGSAIRTQSAAPAQSPPRTRSAATPRNESSQRAAQVQGSESRNSSSRR
ncbi:hypothetical protein FNO01nite_30920 [Flavobacterium noncentrifugens]|uniref:DUF3300 domain-containing protein n=1 Tax=Flavobacterium noncentrifugens TaxID=1128970 RepID=A0A1G9BZD5_9FLAO|nr:hypothetical protein [Flavobacterium noncentrifugens]GEP52420.1 hypothetical protein FNO01nite_30920 [Flavobacterium noncentrifugens]SDK44798.1 hypothetical protein SAMN04487935_3411 [Flavobacterium noncentrifugens]